ncbi:Carbohydrate-binding CenC domain protein [Ferroglobus placidus DSM 10642]|uniref:Carbohydrate-binding CenC domain protein n=1 Tax=Ferroglobus placidus (strain DSM 10642 / AEDII12DO) TaxID=589924 RepID=D3RWI4_FERPA|nr:carbohydrate-binding protein [Ferroglobus placidus]ADC64847.1 Carbohydrate-binding CenC domain protein [Ferroglobus placidus DSM 10642]
MRLKAIALAIIIFFSLAYLTEAKGVPSKVIVWTDKKLYHPWYIYSDRGMKTGNVDYATMKVYVAVLDDDGNFMSGRNVRVYIVDEYRYDHYDKGDSSYHHNNQSTGGLFINTFISLSDSDGDGVYEGTVSLDSYLDNDYSNLKDDHLRIKVVAEDVDSGLIGLTYILASPLSCICHKDYSDKYDPTNKEPTKDLAHGDHVNEQQDKPSDICTVCHYGYEHFYENITDTIPDGYKDVHFYKQNPPDVTYSVKGGEFANYDWNSTWINTSLNSFSWAEKSGGGAPYCANCHINSSTGQVYDWDSSSEIVQCTNCHSETGMENTVPPSAYNSYGTAGKGDVSHYNSSRSGALGRGVACGVCHNSVHSLQLPNESYKEYYIAEQCWSCHNVSGGIDLDSSDSIPNSVSTHPEVTNDCRACHLDNNLALDSHSVPVAEPPSPNCVKCHDIGGKSLVHVDVSAMNTTENRHYNLNNRTDPTANGLRWENRLCWACHGEDDNGDGVIEYSEQPPDQHPAKYRNPRMCTDCHKNATYGSLIGAPQVSRHTWYDSVINTPAVTYCGDCHGLPENVLPNADEEFTYESAAAHYGRYRYDLINLLETDPDAFCNYCHQNETSPYPFANPENKIRPEHSNTGTPPECVECHGLGNIHSTNLTIPSVNDQLCQKCHPDKQPHNGTIGCVECHMNNTPSYIHPMTFLQPDGSVSTSKLTAVSCYDCHKSNKLDNLLISWGATRLPKVKNQHHSESPINGSKWNDYWSYQPRYLTFASSYSVSEGYVQDFSNMMSVSNNFSIIYEAPKGGIAAFKGTFPSNQGFDSNYDGWSYSAESPATAGYDPSYGNPAGSIYSYIYTRLRTTSYYSTEWVSAFVYEKNKPVAYAKFSFDYRVTATTRLNEIKITAYIEDPDGIRYQVYQVSKTSPDVTWNKVEVEMSNPDSVFSKSGVYKIILKTEFGLTTYKGSKEGKVYFDNVKLEINEEEYQQYEVVVQFENVPNTQYTLNLEGEYLVSKEPAVLYIYDYSSNSWGRSFELNATAWKKFRIQLNPNEYQGGVVKIKIDDKNKGIDTIQDYVKFKYLLVQSDTGKPYPCEQCHASEKHENPALGSIIAIMGSNKINTTDLNNSYWCIQCHWKNAANYTEMINEYNLTRGLPVPPEITNGTYAYPVARDGTKHVDHTDWINQYGYSDRACALCHATYFVDGVTTTTEIIHDTEVGTNWTRDYLFAECINCHSTDVNTSNFGRHVNLESDGGLTYKDCIKCHYKLGGMGYNYTATVGLNLYDCRSCHTPEGESNLKPADSNLIIVNFSHGTNLCSNCHYPKGDYHNDYSDPLGTVEAPGWSGWVNGTPVSCNDCHFERNLDDEPFHAPGISRFKASYSSCSGSNCHGDGRIHSVKPRDLDVEPFVSVSLNRTWINPGESILVTAKVSGKGSQISYAYYELLDMDGKVISSADLYPKDGEWGGVDSTILGNGYEEFEFVINGSVTSALKAGIYKVRVTAMQDAPKSREGSYYPRNGAYGSGYAEFSVGEAGSLATNFDFEALNVSGWFVNWKKVIVSGNPVIESSDAVYHSYNHSLHISSSAGDDCYVQSINVSVTEGEKYLLLVWVKGSADFAGISINQWNSSNLVSSTDPVGIIGSTSDWTQFGIIFDALGDLINVQLHVKGNADIYFDDVKLLRMPSYKVVGPVNGDFEYNEDDLTLKNAEEWQQYYGYVNGKDPAVKAWEPYTSDAGINVSKVYSGVQAVEIDGTGFWVSPGGYDRMQDDSSGVWFNASKYYVDKYGIFVDKPYYLVSFAMFADRINDYAGMNITFWVYDKSNGDYFQISDLGFVVGTRENMSDYVVGVVNVTIPFISNLMEIRLEASNSHVVFDDVRIYEVQ